MSITARLSTALADRYRIERHVGEGGMATVYLAEDLKHKRKVAVKVLRPELAAVLGAERFVQEITTTANLQHPHILPLFDSGEADSFLYYVMPFIDGETLRDKLDRETQLGIDEAVKITTEVADALDYAHRHNVIHRDIKPENILLHDGRPMVADFGIALAVSAAAGGRMTETGMSLGTPHYMSPEQATAEKDLTNRSDIYSLGAMLYEMLTGDPPHTGSSAQQIIMKIVTDEARPLTELRKAVPPNVAAATARALEKLPADRFETAAKFSEALANPAFTVPSTRAVAVGSSAWRSPLTIALAALSLVLLATTFWGWFRPRSESVAETPEIESRFYGGSDVTIQTAGFSLSPDGDRLAFVGRDAEGQSAIWIRPLGQEMSTVVPGTDGGMWPFWSPDGRSLGFNDGQALRTADLSSGAARVLCETGNIPWGGVGAWSPDGVILFPAQRIIYRVDAGGGDCLPVTDTLGQIQTHPQFLPDERRFIFANPYQNPTTYVADLESGDFEPLLVGATSPLFVSPDWLLYAPPGQLGCRPVMAQRINPRTLDLIGDPIVAFRDVVTPGGFASYTAAANGVLLGVRRTEAASALVWVTANGVATETIAMPDATWQADATRDGRFIALAGFGLWIHDMSRGIPERIRADEQRRALTFNTAWSPGDSLLAFSTGGIAQQLRVYRVDTGTTDTLWEGPNISAKAWTPDGQAIAFDSEGRIWLYSLREREARPLFTARVWAIEFSPDGRWLLYGAAESVVPDVYVRSYPALEAPRRVSGNGGYSPRWSADGRTIYYVSPTGDIMAVAFGEGGSGSLGEVRTVIAGGSYGGLVGVTPDGKRFLRRQAPPGSEVPQLRLITRWQERVLRSAGAEIGN